MFERHTLGRDTVSIEANKALARRIIEELWNDGRVEAADELIAPDVITHDQPPGEMTVGLDAFKAYVRAFRAQHPRVQFAVDDVLAEGDKVATRVTIRHADGTYAGIGIIRVEDGRIVEQWADTNRLTA